MKEYQVINWSNYSKSGNHMGAFDSLQDAKDYCKHQEEYGAEAQSWEEYSEIFECDEAGNILNTYYFVTTHPKPLNL